MNVALDKTQLENLRMQGLIKETEIAFIAGDLLIAENPVTQTRRVIGESTLISEVSKKRILKG
jgi:hypothetical protein